MTTVYDVIYPQKGRLSLDGGQNNKFERSLIGDNETPLAYNVVFSNGAVGTRGGSSQLNTTAVGSFVNDGLYTKHDAVTAGETMVAFFGGTMYQLLTTTFTTVASAQSVFTAGNRVAATEYQNHMFVGNGGVTPYKYNGTYFTRHGVPQATGIVSLASIAGDIAAGTYMYKIGFMNSQAVEGDVGTAVTIVLSASGNVSITSIPVAPISHGVNQRRVYRTLVGGSSFKLVTTIANNTATTYTDSTTDANLGATAPTDQGEPPKYSVVCYHQNRLFCNDATNLNYLWYSELAEPYTFKVNNFQRVGDNTGDLLRSIVPYQNNILIGCQNSSYILYMPSTDPADWSVIRITAMFGTKSPFGAFGFQNKMMMPAVVNSKFVGFAAINGTDIDPTTTVLTAMTAGGELYSDKIEPDMFDVVASQADKISAITYKNKAYIALTKGSGNLTNNRVYVFDYSIGNLSKDQKFSWIPWTGLQASQFTVYNGNLYFGSANAVGLVHQAETNTYTDGAGSTAIDSYFWTKEFSGYAGHERYVKDFRKLILLIDVVGAFYMDFSYRVDSDNSDGSTTVIDLTTSSSLWGSMTWGSSSWGAGVLQREVTISLGQARGRRIQFKFSNQNTVNQPFKIHGINYTYNIRGMH